jgi:hypothetical protein
MDRQTSEHLLLPTTYGQHLTRVFPPEALLAGAGCLPNMARC